jgi:hypothetical protein
MLEDQALDAAARQKACWEGPRRLGLEGVLQFLTDHGTAELSGERKRPGKDGSGRSGTWHTDQSKQSRGPAGRGGGCLPRQAGSGLAGLR